MVALRRGPGWPLGIAFVLAVASIPVLANHAQSGGGRSVSFDHVTGNEWWVEVAVAGPDAGAVTLVEAQDTNGPWVALQKKSWGPYAASFHIEPGNLVHFRATFMGGAQLASCDFTHPAGDERCPATTTSGTATTTGPASGFDARFSGVRGNEWWVQASVSANGQPLGVEATLDGVNYRGLPQQSWGGYAASFRVIQGSTVQLRAISTAGDVDLSPCYRWIPAKDTDATVVPCPTWTATSTETSTSGTSTTSTSSSTSSTTTSTSPPRSGWTTRALGDLPGPQGPLVADDLDGDGDGDIVLLGDDGIHVLRPTGAAWLHSGAWRQGQVADGDNDGDRELYVFGTPQGQDSDALQRLEFDGNMAVPYPLFGSYDPVGPFHIVDLDADGKQEVYVAHDRLDAWGNVHATLDLVPVAPPGEPFQPPRQVLDLGDGGHGFLTIAALESATVRGTPTMLALALTVDDQDRLENQVYAIRSQEGVLRAQRVGTFYGEPTMFTVGDLDGDGAPDVVTGTATEFDLFLDRGGFWSVYVGRPVWSGDMLDATFGDGDGDGKADLYMAASDGRVHLVRPYSAGGYVGSSVATVSSGAGFEGPFHVVVGNGDADAAREVYSLVLDVRDPAAPRTRVVESAYAPVTFDATFSGVKGNEWWVQANVAANEPVAGVEARVQCGPWHALARQSWGGWAASFHIESGMKVDLRATSTGGASDLSGGYVWPSATPTSGC